MADKLLLPAVNPPPLPSSSSSSSSSPLSSSLPSDLTLGEASQSQATAKAEATITAAAAVAHREETGWTGETNVFPHALSSLLPPVSTLVAVASAASIPTPPAPSRRNVITKRSPLYTSIDPSVKQKAIAAAEAALTPATTVHGRVVSLGADCDVQLIVRQEPNRCRVLAVGEFVDRRPIEPIPVVQLVIKEQATGKILRSNLQQTNFFMSVSLAGLDDATQKVIQERSTNSRTSAFSGGRVSSLYCLRDLDNTDVGFFVFPNLSVRVEGRFKLRFELHTVEGNYVRSLLTVDSKPFTVHPVHSFPGSEASSPLCKILIDQGVKIPFRKRFRASNPPRHLTLKKFGEESTVAAAAGRSAAALYAFPKFRKSRKSIQDSDEGDSQDGSDGEQEDGVVEENNEDEDDEDFAAPRHSHKKPRSSESGKLSGDPSTEDLSATELLYGLKHNPRVMTATAKDPTGTKTQATAAAAAAAAGNQPAKSKRPVSDRPLTTQQLAATFASAPPDFQQVPFPPEFYPFPRGFAPTPQMAAYPPGAFPPGAFPPGAYPAPPGYPPGTFLVSSYPPAAYSMPGAYQILPVSQGGLPPGYSLVPQAAFMPQLAQMFAASAQHQPQQPQGFSMPAMTLQQLDPSKASYPMLVHMPAAMLTQDGTAVTMAQTAAAAVTAPTPSAPPPQQHQQPPAQDQQ